MSYTFSEVMAKQTDAELLKIITELRNDYEAEAIVAAEAELIKRNLSHDQILEAKYENQIKQMAAAERANQPLQTIWKILTFLLPGFIQIIYSGVFKAEGYYRKEKEVIRWTLYGCGFYIGLIILVLILDAIFYQ